VTRLWSAIGFVFALALLGLGGWAVVRGVEADPSVVGSFATALGAIIAVVIQRSREKRQELEQSHREKLAPIYEELLDTMRDFESRGEAENEAFFKRLQTKLLLYGPTPVIQEWLAWRRLGETLSEPNITLVLTWERVLRAIRKDLGHDDTDLQPGDLLRVFVNDLDEALAADGASENP
jgi:hypothetical protein